MKMVSRGQIGIREIAYVKIAYLPGNFSSVKEVRQIRPFFGTVAIGICRC